MRIGEAARQAGVGVETIRFYELKGLIDQPGRPKNGGYRDYSDQEVRCVLFIRSAQQLGFSLSEIGELLALKTSPAAQCVEVREKATAKLHEVHVKIENLGKIKRALRILIESCPGEGPAVNCSIMNAITEGDLDLEMTLEWK
ncbi:MAG: MerR family transcriptional regulator [Rhizobiales bacterium]|nr:MerR family transcriptional regulator [Hyphomicrobiales bacterium]